MKNKTQSQQDGSRGYVAPPPQLNDRETQASNNQRAVTTGKKYWGRGTRPRRRKEAGREEGEEGKRGGGGWSRQQISAVPPTCSHLNVFQLIFQVTPFCLQQISPVQRLLQPLSQSEDVVLLQVHLLLQLGLLVRWREWQEA